jgi:hypothetical protein
MDVNRNQVFLAGLVLLFIGIEFRAMDAFILSPKATKMLAEEADRPLAEAAEKLNVLPPKRVQPPDYVGWLLLSVGSVLVLQSFSMGKPG